MSAKKLGVYQQHIQRVTNCSVHDASMIEDVMRTDVLHTVALDWLSAGQFDEAAREAASLLNGNRADYEEFYAGGRAMFEQMRRESELSRKSPAV